MAKINLMEPIWFTPPSGSTLRPRTLYKGGSAPAADPQVGAAALKQAELGQDAFDFYKSEYEANKPRMQEADELSNQVTKQLLESGDLANAQSKDYYDYMINTFRPMEKDIVDRANEYDTAGRRESEAAKGLSDVRQSFDVQRGMTQRNNERMGVNPNSGNSQALSQQLNTTEAIAGADAANRGRKTAETQGLALKMDAINMGKGLPSNSLTALNTGNASNTSAVNVSNNNIGTQNSGLSVMGAGYSAGMQGYNNQANILNQDYQNRLSAWQAKQNSSDSMWGGIGQLAGTVGGAYISSAGFKDGGHVQDLGLDTVGEEAGEIFEGEGHVRGPGTATSDSINARLSNDEFVMNQGAVKMLGLDALEAINKKGLEYRDEEAMEATQ